MSGRQIEIRRIGPADAALLDNLAPEVFDEPVRPDRLAAHLADPCHLLILALAEDQAVGQCAAVIHRHPDKPHELYVDEVGVTPALQQQGIARRMMQEMFAWGRELGCASAWLGTETDNLAAIALYKSLGEDPQPIMMFEFDLNDL
jgi:ribosomal protein S18 acetylase RimI-like enzyme